MSESKQVVVDKKKAKKKEKKKSKTKSKLKKLVNMIKRSDEDYLDQTMSELIDIAEALTSIYSDAEERYEKTQDKEKGSWDALHSRFPRMFQSKAKKKEMDDLNEISSSKWKIQRLKQQLEELQEADKEQQDERVAEIYAELLTASQKAPENSESIEERIEQLELNFIQQIDDINLQLSLIKSSLNDLTILLQEQGAKIDGLDTKIDEVNSKLTKAQETLKKISQKITSSQILTIITIGAVAVVAVGLLT